METRVAEDNREDFYLTLYRTNRELLDLDQLPGSQYIVIDSNGIAYRKKYPEKNIILLESISTAKQFKLSRQCFDKLFDNQIYNRITWPSLDTDDHVVVIDQAPIFKYLTITETVDTLNNIGNRYRPKQILFNVNPMFIDDDRTGDRFNNICKISIDDYMIEQFIYDPVCNQLTIKWKSKIRL
jgi:hypothetical protein